MRDDTFCTKSGAVNLRQSKGTHWVMFINEYYFDSYGYPPPRLITNHINKGNIQNNKLGKMMAIVRRIAYTLYTVQIQWIMKMQY